MITLENRSIDTTRTSLWRSRWAAIGAAVAVSLGAGGIFVAQAAPGPLESTIVSVAPERILDTRDGNDIGLPGPFTSPAGQKLQVTGSIPTATGTKIVVPTGATGVLLNVTSVGSTASGFISVRPGDATGAPTTSSLNITAGVIVPNSVQVAMPTAGANAGKIDITYDAFGVAGRTTDVLIDVVGYTTNTGLQELVADVAAKASVASGIRTTDMPLTGAMSPVVTANITTVAGSSLLVTAAIEVKAAGGNDNMNCNLSVDGTLGPLQSIGVADTSFDIDSNVLAMTQVFPVGAGSRTVTVLCNQGVGSVATVESATLSVLAIS